MGVTEGIVENGKQEKVKHEASAVKRPRRCFKRGGGKVMWERWRKLLNVRAMLKAWWGGGGGPGQLGGIEKNVKNFAFCGGAQRFVLVLAFDI